MEYRFTDTKSINHHPSLRGVHDEAISEMCRSGIQDHLARYSYSRRQSY